MENKDVTNSDKRQATRRALLDAARDLVFEKGHDRISVQEITDRARTATGTYYNYFETKQEVFVAVAEDLKQELAAELEKSRATVSDPAMRVAMTLKFYFYQSADNQDWREFIRCTGLDEMSLQQDEEECHADILKGVNAGRFKVDDVHFTSSLVSGMIRHVNRGIEQGQVGRSSIEFAIRSILQMLGMPELVSRALTQTPLPPVQAPKRSRRPTPVPEVTPITRFTELKKFSDQPVTKH